jgi:DNA-binding MarR family transcriptional regulator
MAQVYRGQRSMNNVTPRQREVLRLLATRATWSIGEVARALGVSYPAATKFAIRLERQGMITRMRGDDDRRFTRIILTSHGKQQLFPM